MKPITYLVFGLIVLLSFSCVEEIDFATYTETFESALVVEATITNEYKQQQVKLSRTYKIEEDGPNPETGAQVTLLVNGSPISFVETENGMYLSETAFAAQHNADYQLKVITSNGRKYSSTPIQLTQETQIDNIYAERITNEFGEDGIAIRIDSFDPTSNSRFYRYEYEETYKIIAPFYSGSKLIVTGNVYPNCSVQLVSRDEDVRTCFKTDFSTNIILTSTQDLQEDIVEGFQVCFLNKNNFKISHRYSVLVKQYVQQPEAFLYYSKLKDIAEQDSNLFSQLQPGFLNGNIFSETNTEEKVVGYFEVASVSKKRIFFNYTDFYPDEPLPPYVISCVPFAPKLSVSGLGGSGRCGELITSLEADRITFWDINSFPEPGEGPYLVVIKECGDCTALGTNEVPDFWVE